MALSPFETDLKIHQSLGDDPNVDNNLTAEQLKQLFDFPAVNIQDWINNTLIPAFNAIDVGSSIAVYVQEDTPGYAPCIWFKPLAGGGQEMHYITADRKDYKLNPQAVVTTDSLVAGSVTTDKIANKAVTADKLYDKYAKANRQGINDALGFEAASVAQAGTYPVEPIGAEDGNYNLVMNANVYYTLLNAPATINITMNAQADANRTAEYCFEFVAGTTSPKINGNIRWASAPGSYVNGRRYQASIVNGIGVMVGA